MATAVAGHAASALAQHAGVVAHSADVAHGIAATGLLAALDAGARDVFRDPFDDPSPEAPAPRLVLLATGEDDPTQAVLRRTGRGLPDPDVLHPVDEVVRGAPHAALLRAALLASRCDVAAVYLGLATRAIEPA
jgi:hypothetical protein